MIASCVVDISHRSPQRAFVKRGVDIYRCPTCGSLMGDLAFVHEQYEAANYYTLAYQDSADVEQEWGFRWRYLLGKMASLISKPYILDVGAGNGYFVHLARREFGFAADGVEISAAEIRYAEEKFGVDLINRPLPELGANYDVVTSFNVLEHVQHPTELLADMRARLRPGGYLFLTTPNPSCIHCRVSGLEKWGMVDPPHHINLFTRAGLEQLLLRSGFTACRYETLSTYIRFVRNFDTESLLLRKALFHMLRLANLGADHFFVARKGDA
jgi:2-polyprenyl-3-methyl-5-hydroxy-6-metoxy-1,4-benzoquinol methylase